MDCIITAIFLSVLKAALSFNIDPVPWKSLSHNAAGFGYQVVQRQSDILVSAPLEQYSARGRGQILTCSISSCTQLKVPLPEFAVNASLGLTMVNDPNKQRTLVCGPTIPKDCTSITMYKGVCVEIDRLNRVANPFPSSMEECPSEADIAFLLDGSGSVSNPDFSSMKSFVTNLIRSLKGKDARFAIAQYSHGFKVHYYFNQFSIITGWERQISSIDQISGGTNTASAIKKVVRYIFSTNSGSRANVKKILIVITDGESYDSAELPNARRDADAKKIVRFAVGVGKSFSNPSAKRELDTIASNPPDAHVFRVGSFTALEIIRQKLQERIFSIEGSQAAGESLKMEMSQMGFSAAFAPSTEAWNAEVAAVGINQWKGGYGRYKSSGEKISSYEPDFMEPDSYLGYSMAIAQTRQGPLTIAGAPRYQHRGVVLAVQPNGKYKMINPYDEQTGQYFGAVVCAMKVNRDTYTDLIVISAPMFMDADREGRAYVCSLSGLNVDCQSDSPLILRGDESEYGRFGSSLAALPDINADGLKDLAIGAPLENDGRGSIYIFHGEGMGGVSLTYSQRIVGSKDLKYFGMSISSSSFDHSSDDLPDLAVGSKGKVVLLRSKPIVMVEATVSFSPSLIPPQYSDCSAPLTNTAQICFVMTRYSAVTTAQARINFTLTLDATRSIFLSRAYITEKRRVWSGSNVLDLRQRHCVTVNFFVKSCLDDALNALYNELSFTFEGLPSAANLSPSLALQAKTTSTHPLGFQIDCGEDSKCVDNLVLDFNFTSSSEVKVGIDELLNVTISLENSEENSYNAHVILTYPAGLSYRKLTTLQGRIECNSLDSENGVSRGKTDCMIDRPIFRSSQQVFFTVSYGIGTYSQLDSRIFFTANATSENQEHSPLSKPYSMKWIDVKYSLFISFESTLSYNNFTFGYDNVQKPVLQSLEVRNDIRELNLTIVIKVPVKLGKKDIWVDSNRLQFPDCNRDNDEEPSITDFVAQIQKDKVVDCSVATCSVFRCNRFMGRLETRKYKFNATLTSGWIQQIGLKSAKFLLTSTASVEYDKNRYIFFSTGSSNNAPIRKIIAEVEVYPEDNFTKEIIGGSVGGLVLLALITLALYKAGFFKSKYSKMISENAEGEGEGGGETEDLGAGAEQT